MLTNNFILKNSGKPLAAPPAQEREARKEEWSK